MPKINISHCLAPISDLRRLSSSRLRRTVMVRVSFIRRARYFKAVLPKKRANRTLPHPLFGCRYGHGGLCLESRFVGDGPLFCKILHEAHDSFMDYLFGMVIRRKYVMACL